MNRFFSSGLVLLYRSILSIYLCRGPAQHLSHTNGPCTLFPTMMVQVMKNYQGKEFILSYIWAKRDAGRQGDRRYLLYIK